MKLSTITCKSVITAVMAPTILIISSTTVNAQIDYTSQGIQVTGSSETSKYGINVKNMNGIKFVNINPDPTMIPQPAQTNETASNNGIETDGDIATNVPVTCYYLMNLSGTSPMICGSSNSLFFVNPNSYNYNAIHVGAVYNLSDLRAKRDIKDLSMGLPELMLLRPVSYKWKHNQITDSDSISPNDKKMAFGPESEGGQIGFIAQEVEEIIPQAVNTDPSGNKAINYSAIIPVLVKSIQDLEAEVQSLREKVSVLEESIQASGISTDGNKILSCMPNPAKDNVTVAYEIEYNVN